MTRGPSYDAGATQKTKTPRGRLSPRTLWKSARQAGLAVEGVTIDPRRVIVIELRVPVVRFANLRCLACGAQWFASAERNGSLKRGWRGCPNRCNAPRVSR